MKTYGTLKLIPKCDGTRTWEIKAEPFVMIRLKSVFPKINKGEIGTVTLRDSPETCCDLEWFISRYPLHCENPNDLQCEAESYRDTMREMERYAHPDYKPRDFDLKIPARDYQKVAAEMCLTKGSQLLADQLGLGKSVSAMAALTDKRTLPALVVVEAHLPRQWMEYIKKFMPEAKPHLIEKVKGYPLPPADIYVITYHKLASWAEVLKGMIRCIIFDEVQALRHEDSLKYSAALAIRKEASYCMGLSATPIYNYGGEIFNIMDVICPGSLGDRTEFIREWCFSNGGHILLRDSEAFGAWLRDQRWMLMRTKKDVGRELPKMQTIIHTVEYNEGVLKDLDKIATELAHRILSSETRFNEKGVAARDFDLKLRQATGIAKAPYVAAFVRILVEGGQKVVLTGWHRAVYSIWYEQLKDLGVVFYTGTESNPMKTDSVDEFVNGKAMIFILSLRSGAGLDGLQKVCSNVVHGELDWSPSVMQQCTGRVNRDGQEESVSEYYLISDAGSDPIISQIIGLKKSQLGGILAVGGASKAERKEPEEGARVKKMAAIFLERRKNFK